jgi:hypothetical protein
MPPQPANSKYLDEIGKEGYPEAQAPATPPLMRWNFSVKKIYGYDYTELEETSLSTNSLETFHTADSAGTLLMKTEGNNYADFILRDIKIKIKVPAQHGRPAREGEQILPMKFIQGVKDDGVIRVNDSAQDLLLKMMFPLPPKALQPGQSYVQTMSLPYNALGNGLNMTGTLTTTLTNYVIIDNHPCARLESVVDISKLDVPKNLEGNYLGMLKGRTIFYFDMTDRCFVSGAMALLISMRLEGPTTKLYIPGLNSRSPQMPKKVRIVMDIDNLIRVKRNPAKGN